MVGKAWYGEFGRWRPWVGALAILFAFLTLLRSVPPELSLGGTLVLIAVWYWLPGERRASSVAAGRLRPRADWLVLAVSVVLSLVLLEAGVRIAAPRARTMVHGHYVFNGEVFTPHPRLLWCLEPGAVRTFTFPSGGGERTFTIRVSSQGLRDREIPAKRPDEFRIVMVGDSFTMGWGLESPYTIPSQLERYLQASRPGAPVTVVNAGVTGYGPWQEHLMLDERGWRLDPDLVVLQVLPANDVANSLCKSDRYLHAYLEEVERSVVWYKRQCLWPFRPETAARDHLESYRLLVESLHAEGAVQWLLRDLRFLPRVSCPSLPERNVCRMPKLEVDLREWYPELEQGWSMFTEDILKIRAACEARGVDFLVYCVPPTETVCDSVWDWAMWKYGADPARYERGKSVALAERFFEEQGLPYISVKGVLAGAPDPCALYIPDDGHLNEDGARLVAEVLGEGILARQCGGQRHTAVEADCAG